jgi:hypothetical protein
MEHSGGHGLEKDCTAILADLEEPLRDWVLPASACEFTWQ